MNSKKLFLIGIDLTGRNAVLIGGGPAAAPFLRTLLLCCPSIRVVAPSLSEEMQLLVQKQAVTWTKASYDRSYILGADLVFACEEDPKVNAEIYAVCKCLGILVYNSTEASKCDFYLPDFLTPCGKTAGVQEMPAQASGNTHSKLSEAGSGKQTGDPDPDDSDLRLVHAVQHLRFYQWILFEGRESVEAFFRQMRISEVDLRAMGHLKAAACGRGAAKALRERGFFPDLVRPAGAEDAVAAELAARDDAGARILVLRGSDETAVSEEGSVSGCLRLHIEEVIV